MLGRTGQNSTNTKGHVKIATIGFNMIAKAFEVSRKVIGVSRPTEIIIVSNRKVGHQRNCLCTNVDTTYPAHNAIPWMVCYDLNCDCHEAEKERNGYMPEEPKIVEKARHWCLYRILDCTSKT